jgi:hypothetical protein
MLIRGVGADEGIVDRKCSSIEVACMDPPAVSDVLPIAIVGGKYVYIYTCIYKYIYIYINIYIYMYKNIYMFVLRYKSIHKYTCMMKG